jgi:hypothetical protein
MNTTAIHPFTRAGFGAAPFRCIGMTKEVYSAAPGHMQPGANCDYCGTAIMYAYWCVPADDATRKFKVGCDCVMKTHADVQGFAMMKAKHDKELRDARNAARRQANQVKRAAEHAARVQQWADEAAVKREAFTAANGDVVEFLKARDAQPFFADMLANIAKWGALTDGQLAAVRKSMERETLNATSVYQGEVGKPLTVSLEILATRTTCYRDTFPVRVVHWHLMRDAKGNVYTMSGVAIGDKGEHITGTFTVKKHETYNGAAQTVLQRPRKLTTQGKA